MADSFFDKLSKDLKAIRTPGSARKAANEAIDWYSEKIKGSNASTIGAVLYGKRNIDAPKPGQLMTFRYDAKGFEEGRLPYYDASPLIVFLDINKHDNILGLNLHYLPPHVRLRVFGFMVEGIGATKLRHDTKLRINYQKVQSLAQFEPLQFAIKSYIPGRIGSKIVRVQPNEWRYAVALPFAKFLGKNARRVWRDGGF